MTTVLVRAGIRKKKPFLYLAEKWFFGQKSFFPKKKSKFAKRLVFILEKGTFLFAQLFPVVARTWLEPRSALLFGPENSNLGPKIRLLPR